MKVEFIVSDMTCNHCVRTITQAVQDAVPGTTVQIDLPSHRVTLESAGDPAVLAAAIREAGYDVQPA